MNWLTLSIRFIRSFELSQEWFERNRGPLIRIAGILVILFAAIFISPRVIIGNYTIPKLFLLAVLGIIAVIVIIKYPNLLLIGIIPITMLVPFSIGTGTGTPISAVVMIDLAAIGFWVMDLVVNHKSIRNYSMPVIPAVALIGSAVISFGFGQLSWFNTNHAPIFSQIGGTMLYVMTAGLFLVAAHRLTRRGLIWMVVLFIMVGGFYITARFFSERGGYFLIQIVRKFSEGAFGSIFWVWMVCLPIGLILFYKRMNWLVRAVLIGFVGMTIYISFIESRDWTSGWFPAFVAIAIMLWVGLPKWRLPVFFVTILIMALGWHIIYNVFISTVFTSDNIYSEMTRFAAWKILMQIFLVSPVVGLGPANYYFYTPLYPIMGYSVSFNSHNNYIDLLMQTGIIGFACFLWFTGQATRLGFKLTHQVKDGFEKAFIIAATGGVIGTAVAALFGDWVIPFVYNVGFDGFRASIFSWLFIGGMSAIERYLLEEHQTGNLTGIQKEEV